MKVCMNGSKILEKEVCEKRSKELGKIDNIEARTWHVHPQSNSCIPLGIFNPRLPEPLVIIFDQPRSKDLCQLAASYQSSYLPSSTLARASLKTSSMDSISSCSNSTSNRASRVSSFVSLTLSRNVGFCEFQWNNILKHHCLGLSILLRYLLQDEIMKKFTSQNALPASIGYS